MQIEKKTLSHLTHNNNAYTEQQGVLALFARRRRLWRLFIGQPISAIDEYYDPPPRTHTTQRRDRLMKALTRLGARRDRPRARRLDGVRKGLFLSRGGALVRLQGLLLRLLLGGGAGLGLGLGGLGLLAQPDTGATQQQQARTSMCVHAAKTTAWGNGGVLLSRVG